jgi:tRNA-specific 2-thiouridylase
LTQEQLRQVIFPVGMLEKTEVRKLAANYHLPVAQKHESQEICFIPDNNYVAFLESRGVAQAPGEIVTIDGTVVGRHSGLHCYTIGQRKGLGVAWHQPLHVLAMDTENNRVVVGERQSLARAGLTAGEAVWNITPVAKEFRAACRIRYRHNPAPCRVVILDDRRFTVHFDTPQSAVASGQAAVLYDNDSVLGGGWIE